MTAAELLATPICFGGRTADGSWVPGLFIVLPLAVVVSVYAAGSVRIWQRSALGRSARLQDALLFAAGMALLAAALASPLHGLSDRLFTAHMIEHELLMAGAAPLLALSRPGASLLWGLPAPWRKTLGSATHWTPLANTWAVLSRPAVATLVHGAAIWLWHVPALFEAVLARGFLHYLQHASFFGTGLLFWWVLLSPGRRGQNAGTAVMHLFFTSLHTGLLGVLLLLAPQLWYPANGFDAAAWGMTPLEDQQVAGLVMWVPAGLVYAGAALAMAGSWICASGRQQVGLAHDHG